MLQGRLISYPDAHRYRIGVNYNLLPINEPKCPYSTYNRDGSMRFGDNGGNGEAASDTAELYRARTLRKKTMLIDVPVAQGVDVYIFCGPAMLTAVQRYNLFSGGGCVPPLWGLGVAFRGLGKFSAEESAALARRVREQHIPCDVWGLEPGWQTKSYSCSGKRSSACFPLLATSTVQPKRSN